MKFLLHFLWLFLSVQKVSTIIHFFTPEELQYTFGVKNFNEVPKYEEVDPRLFYSDNGELERIVLEAMDKSFDLSLKPTVQQLVHPAMTIIHRDEQNGGKLIVDEAPTSCHFHHRSNSTIAAISNCDGRVKGTIIDRSGIHVIHPFPDRHAHRSKRSTENGAHIVYKRESLANPDDNFCGLENEITEEDLVEDESGVFEDVFVTGMRLQEISDLVVELAVFVDEELWRHFNSKYGGLAQRKLTDYMLTLLNNIQIMYYQPTASPPLTFRVVRFEILRGQPAALAAHTHSYGNAQRYLDRFCKYQRNLAVRDWDHAFMLTGYDIHRGGGSRSISGIARLDGMCDPWNTCTLAEGLDFTSAFIGTHELGHSVGMRHDEPYCQSTHIMSASLGPGKVTWSTCSLRDYHQFLQKMDGHSKNCLRVSNMPEKLVLQKSTKPGQLYDANMQCALMHGPGYQQVTPRRDSYDGICYMMWCGQSSFGRIITSHPALEGTFCGPNKWCQLGRCVPWTPDHNEVTLPPQIAPATTPPAPRRVDGGWSGWSTANCDQCTCNPIQGGIGLAISKRTCSNPYPLNGGSECTGSKTRALSCGRPCPAATQTVDQYITARCSEQKRIKNDQDLTGTGSQLTRFPQRACKIFCDVANRYGTQRNYRFFGDNLPDGTSCGYERYCLEGECLALTCNRNALIARDQSCPVEYCPVATTQAPAAPTTTAVYAQWGTWSLWTSCSVTCGGGYRRRERKCSIYGRCEGGAEQTEICGQEACPAPLRKSPEWSTWTDWNRCSVSCGRGSQARYRKCVMPDGRLSFNCAGMNGVMPSGVRVTTFKEKNIEVRICDAGSCTVGGIWSNWGEFSTCSVSCGPGIMTRQRMCMREPCDGSAYERQSCSMPACPVPANPTGEWESWTEWSECSRVCGTGLRSRSRYCRGYGCTGGNNEQEYCNTQACDQSQGDWSTWSIWSACSASCGTGVKRRTRYCRLGNCPGNYKESTICNERECQSQNAAWGGWGFWSDCSSGYKKRVRKCYGFGQCPGLDYEEQQCSDNELPFRRRFRFRMFKA